tara:strand:+ start:2126 stop:2431 length:306 start_codon:yes stop_codon:yes gene_type:complete
MFEKQNLKEEIKLVENLIHKFDKENYFFRFKLYDVYEYKNELFVEYVTQQDHDGNGKSMLIDLLSDISFAEDVNIYLYYVVRDEFRSDDRDYFTKKGFKLI